MNAYAKVGAALLVLVTGFGAGWLVQGWRQAETIAELQKERSDEISTQATAALADLTSAAKTIKENATGATVSNAGLASQLALVRKDLKNAQAKAPLAVGCKPDAGRVRNLAAAVDATNQAAFGSVPGK